MAERWFPLHPDVDQLRRQARELLEGFRRQDPSAVADFAEHHPERIAASGAVLADAQQALARSYGFPSWPRLVLSCRMTQAIWDDDIETVRVIASRHPEVVRHHAHRNWGPPMSFAANLGRDRIVALLRGCGAQDVQWAFDRACLQGRLDTARLLYAMGARPQAGAVMGPCETQNAAGLAFVLELVAEPADVHGDRLAPVGLLLETYCRNPEGKHRCLELLAERGAPLPDTPTMAVHRGRIDLLESHWRRDPHLPGRTFTHAEIFPVEVGCHGDPEGALNGTPPDGGTLLHLCVDGDEAELAAWLLEHGADANARAAVDGDGFGGHTALFGAVVSQPYATGRDRDGAMARLLLAHGADPNVRASLRKRLRDADDETMHEYPDVTPLAWGRRFHARQWANAAAMALIEAAGGRT